MRGKSKYKAHNIKPDILYGSVDVAKFINYVMDNGKKDLANKLVYSAFDKVSKQLNLPVLEVFGLAIDKITPQLEVKPRRIGGATYQVPVEVKPNRAKMLAYRWLIKSAKAGKGKPFDEKLAEEMISAIKESGNAYQMKINMHKAADANKAFSHFARH